MNDVIKCIQQGIIKCNYLAIYCLTESLVASLFIYWEVQCKAPVFFVLFFFSILNNDFVIWIIELCDLLDSLTSSSID